jgi:hypothetical protein
MASCRGIRYFTRYECGTSASNRPWCLPNVNLYSDKGGGPSAFHLFIFCCFVYLSQGKPQYFLEARTSGGVFSRVFFGAGVAGGWRHTTSFVNIESRLSDVLYRLVMVVVVYAWKCRQASRIVLRLLPVIARVGHLRNTRWQKDGMISAEEVRHARCRIE